MALGDDSNTIRLAAAQTAAPSDSSESAAAPGVTGLFEVSGTTTISTQQSTTEDRTLLQYATSVHIRYRKVVRGACLALFGAICFAGTVFCVRKSLRSNDAFYGPFFVSYFMTAWTISFYPVYVVTLIATSKGRVSMRDISRDGRFIFRYGFASGSFPTSSGSGSPAPQPKFMVTVSLVGKCCVLTFVWTLTTYTFARSASSIRNSGDVTALFSCHETFVYIMSWMVLQQQFASKKVLAFIVAMTGVNVITYNRTDSSTDVLVCTVMVVSTAFGAFYQVLMKLFFNAITPGQLALCQSVVGLFYLVTVWPFLLVLYFTGAESLSWSQAPWLAIFGTSLFAVGLHVVMLFGKLISSSILVETCLILAIPLSIAVDIVLQNSIASDPRPDAVQITAYFIIAASYVISNLPPDWLDRVGRLFGLRPRDSPDLRSTPGTMPAGHQAGRRMTIDQTGAR